MISPISSTIAYMAKHASRVKGTMYVGRRITTGELVIGYYHYDYRDSTHYIRRYDTAGVVMVYPDTVAKYRSKRIDTILRGNKKYDQTQK